MMSACPAGREVSSMTEGSAQRRLYVLPWRLAGASASPMAAMISLLAAQAER
jgi:hypothetical protein